MAGKMETCPACNRKRKVPDYAAIRARNPATDRQEAFAASLGFLLPEGTTKDEAAVMLDGYLDARHYLYGLWIDLTGQRAGDSGVPRGEVERIARWMVEQKHPLLPLIRAAVGDNRSSAEFLFPDTPLYDAMAQILRHCLGER